MGYKRDLIPNAHMPVSMLRCIVLVAYTTDGSRKT